MALSHFTYAIIATLLHPNISSVIGGKSSLSYSNSVLILNASRIPMNFLMDCNRIRLPIYEILKYMDAA